jgi:hypothetical protein
LVKFESASTAITTGAAPGPYCAGASFGLAYTATGTFNSGNIFTAQLSDASGSFASPTNIGTLASTTSGTINATIPGATPTGTGYRIRVVSSDPSVVGSDNGANITINALPSTPMITPGGPTTFCDGGSVTLTSSAGSGNQWIKDGMDLTGETGTTLNVTTSGNYQVRVTVSGCSSTSAITTVTVNANPPVPTITPGGPTTFCDGGSVTLTSSAGSDNQWIKDGMDLTGETGTSLNVTTPGDYRVRVTISGCSSTSAVTTVTVNANPALSIDAVVHPSCGGCTDGALSLSGGATYRLDMGTPQASGEFADLGVGSYDAKAISAAGCEDVESVSLAICEKVTIVAVGNLLATSAMPRWNKAEAKPGFPNGRFHLQWRVAPSGMWNTMNDLADTAYTIMGLTPSTTYHVRVSYACGDGRSNWSDITVISTFTTLPPVCPMPTGVITSAAGSSKRNVSWTGDAMAASYEAACGMITAMPSSWPTMTVAHPTTTVQFTGVNPTKQYRARVRANCNAPTAAQSSWSLTSAVFMPNARAASTDAVEGAAVEVYPNPNRGTFAVRASFASNQTAELRMTDALGRTVYRSTVEFAPGANEVEVSVKAARGVYALTLTATSGVWTTKVVVE